MNLRQLFLQRIAQTSTEPLALEITSAKGVHLEDTAGKSYIDLISGIAVSNVGHSHPKVVDAVKAQAEKYMHLMVYGEFVEQPQVEYANNLTKHLPQNLETVYYTNSGAEAADGAMKLAKRYTERTEIVYFKNSYHGSTMGTLSVLGDEFFKSNYRPLIPGNRMLNYNCFEDLEQITNKTAAVLIEPIQAEIGVGVPSKGYLEAVRKKCNEVGALLIFDEIQTGMGRTGTLFRFQKENVVPDILLLAKAFGGGMPLGAFISSREKFEVFQDNPFLGHITTFGGHPVSCVAGNAALEIITKEGHLEKVEAKGQLFDKLLVHPRIKKINRAGLMMAVYFEDFEENKSIIDKCIEKGLITDWFLFAPQCLRIAPPLIITENEIRKACEIILESLEV
ncbi:MAG: aspartate aminotransferase family protein [Chitinophagales bacterium]